MPVSCLTFNVYNHPDFDTRLPAIEAVIEAAGAAVACLQEVPTDPARARQLADGCGYPCWARTTFLRPEDGWSESLLTMTRLPLSESETIELRPGVPNCIRARVSVAGKPVDVYNLHLHPRDSELRQREIAVVLTRLALEPTVPALVCGDFNAVPEGKTMAPVWPILASAFDMATGRHPDTTFPTPLRPPSTRTPGFSERREAPPRDDESEAKAAIDYVLVRRRDFDALAARVVGVSPVEGVWPSDHYGLWVELEPK